MPGYDVEVEESEVVSPTPISWNPLPHQAEFISIPDTIKEGFFGGSVGPGKTDTLLMLPLVREFYKVPGFKGLMLRRTMPEHEREVIPRSKQIFPYTGAKFVGGKKSYWYWPEYNSYYFFGHAKETDDIRRYDGTQWNYIGFDELTSFEYFQYTYMLQRSRSGIPNFPVAIIRSASNPGNEGHHWVRQRFIEPAREGRKIIIARVKDEETGKEYDSKRIFIPAVITDNPHLIKNNPDYVASLYAIPDKAERDAKLKGDWWTFTGQVFSDLRIEHIPGEPENALHVIEPFVIPVHWPRVLAVDWGSSAMTCAHWAAIAPQGDAFLYREYSLQGKNNKVSTWGTEIGELARGENLVANCLDSNAWNTTNEEKTVVDQYIEYSGLEPEKASKDRISGKLLIQEYLRWREIERPEIQYDKDYADFLLKSGNFVEYKKYIGEDRYKDKHPLPRIKIFSGAAPELLTVLPLCQYDTRGRKKEDVKPFSGDDPYDTFRYLCKLIHRYVNKSSKLQQEMQEQDRLLKIAKIDINQYAMLQQMKPKEKPFAVTRYSHRRGRKHAILGKNFIR